MTRTNNSTIEKSNLSLYLKEINKIDLLTREEEDTIARMAREGDVFARERLVNANLRFVVNVAKKYQNQGLPIDDLISEGNIGLINAIEKFDPDKGYHFISYAVWWIRQAILKAIYEKTRMIRLPLNRTNELVQIRKAKKELTAVLGEEPEIRDIADELNMDEAQVRELLDISRDMVSLETPVYNSNGNSQLSDFIENDRYNSPDEDLMQNAVREDINKLLETLTDKEADIIERRFGLNNKKALSLKDIGDRYGLTKERIRQIEKKALRKLQHPSRRQYLEAYIA